MLNVKCILKLLRSPIFWILVIAGVLRLYQLGSVPSGFFRDEASKGYNAYCLLESGRDIDNRFLPIFTREFRVYNSALPTYLIIPSIAIFGLTEFATRLPFAIAGILTILGTYLLVARVYSQRAGYIAALILAITPWHLFFSRWANQGILLPLFVVFGLYSWMRAVEKPGTKLNWWLILSLAIFGLSLYTYDIAKVFIPLLLLGLIVFYRKELSGQPKSSLFIALCVLIVILIPLLWFSYSSTALSQERFNRISIFNGERSVGDTFGLFITNYLSHFSPSFLFIHGDKNLRHNFAGGELNLFELPFLVFGLYLVLKRRTKFDTLLFWWLIIFPIPASLTNEGIPHALRSICALPVFSIMAAIGLNKCLEFKPFACTKQNKYIIVPIVIIILIVANIDWLLMAYFYRYPIYSAPAWDYGWKQAVTYLDTVKPQYQEIVVSQQFGAPHIFILFYDRVPPHSWQTYEWNIPPYRFDIPDDEIINNLQYSVDSSILFVRPSSEKLELQLSHAVYYKKQIWGDMPAICFLHK
ncbi:MAG: ArnT family glycosyltransferase [bacterium]